MPPLLKSGDQRRANEPGRTANEYVQNLLLCPSRNEGMVARPRERVEDLAHKHEPPGTPGPALLVGKGGVNMGLRRLYYVGIYIVSMHIHGLSERFPAGSIRFGWRSCWSALSSTLCTCVLTLTRSSPGRREVGEALGAWWGGLVRSGRRTPGPSCFRRSDLARHATAGQFIRHEFCKEVCEKGLFRAPDAALSSAVSVVALLAFCLTSGTKGVRLPA